MSDVEPSRELERLLEEAAQGDMRPQFNPHALLSRRELPAEPAAFEAVLRDRFFQLSRPIADASQGGADEMRLQDAGRFFYLVESLQRLGYRQLEETLLVILDEFLQLESSAYNELYLWCIVQLSRADLRHVHTFWPMVLALDQRYRREPWQRPAGVAVVDQPHRFTELLFYFYVLYTLHKETPTHMTWYLPVKRYPSLGFCLMNVAPLLTFEQLELAEHTLRHLERQQGRIAYGDAHGLIENLKRERLASKPGPRHGV